MTLFRTFTFKVKISKFNLIEANIAFFIKFSCFFRNIYYFEFFEFINLNIFYKIIRTEKGTY